MKTIYFLYLLFFVLLMCTGQILFKKTALILSQSHYSMHISKVFESLLILIKIPYFFLAFISLCKCDTFLVIYFAKDTIKYRLSIYSLSYGYNSYFKHFSFPRKAKPKLLDRGYTYSYWDFYYFCKGLENL